MVDVSYMSPAMIYCALKHVMLSFKEKKLAPFDLSIVINDPIYSPQQSLRKEDVVSILRRSCIDLSLLRLLESSEQVIEEENKLILRIGRGKIIEWVES